MGWGFFGEILIRPSGRPLRAAFGSLSRSTRLGDFGGFIDRDVVAAGGAEGEVGQGGVEVVEVIFGDGLAGGVGRGGEGVEGGEGGAFGAGEDDRRFLLIGRNGLGEVPAVHAGEEGGGAELEGLEP